MHDLVYQCLAVIFFLWVDGNLYKSRVYRQGASLEHSSYEVVDILPVGGNI
jgi:hypothetical protein